MSRFLDARAKQSNNFSNNETETLCTVCWTKPERCHCGTNEHHIYIDSDSFKYISTMNLLGHSTHSSCAGHIVTDTDDGSVTYLNPYIVLHNTSKETRSFLKKISVTMTKRLRYSECILIHEKYGDGTLSYIAIPVLDIQNLTNKMFLDYRQIFIDTMNESL